MLCLNPEKVRDFEGPSKEYPVAFIGNEFEAIFSMLGTSRASSANTPRRTCTFTKSQSFITPVTGN